MGQAMVERFAVEGAIVGFIDRDADRGHALADRLNNAHFYEADLASADAISETVAGFLTAHNQIDILVNNAGVILPKGIEEISADEWDWLMAINLRAPFLMVQAALPSLKETRGSVLNIASTAALKVFGRNVPYISAKAGLIAMTKCLALDLHPFGVRVNCICPGAVNTPLLEQDIEVRQGDDVNPQDVLSTLDDRRILVQPESIAATALHLVSDEGMAMTGSCVVVDAGAMLL